MANYNKGKNTQNNILSASRILFYNQGYSQTTTRQIAEKAHINLGLIKYYFDSKADIAYHIYLQIRNVYDELFEAQGYSFVEPIEADSITLNIKELQTGIKNRLFACDTMSQNVLSGVCFDKDKIATCNGNMLAVYTLSEQLPFDTVVLTNKLCQEILKCFDDETVQVSMTNNKVMFKSDKITLIGRLLDGKYPQYRALIPHPEHHATINKSLVINAIELLKLIDEKSCTFNFNEDRLVISVSDSNTEIDIKYSGVEMSITFNSNYMINCLKNIDSEVIDFGFTDNRTGATLSTDKELTVLMPIVR